MQRDREKRQQLTDELRPRKKIVYYKYVRAFLCHYEFLTCNILPMTSSQ